MRELMLHLLPVAATWLTWQGVYPLPLTYGY